MSRQNKEGRNKDSEIGKVLGEDWTEATICFRYFSIPITFHLVVNLNI